MARARYIIRTENQHPKLVAKYGQYTVNIVTGDGHHNRAYHCNSDRALQQRVAELEAAEADYRILYFPSFREAVRYVYDTTMYLNNGIKPNPWQFNQYGLGMNF